MTLGADIMSINNANLDDGSTEPQTGTDLKADLKTVGGIAAAAFEEGHDDDNFGQASHEAARDLAEFFSDREVPPQRAIAAAWFFILSFDQ